VYRHPYDLEINARYTRERVAETVAATRRVPRSTMGRCATGTPAILTWLRRGVGQRLIAAGERLAGSSACRPATPRPAA
jgi:hypothetical protein